MHSLLSVVTIVTSDEDVGVYADFLGRLGAIPERRELVTVCYGLSSQSEVQMTTLVNAMPDTTLHFLPQPVSPEIAILIGLDNAIGERCLVVNLHEDLSVIWPDLEARNREGYDVVLTRHEHGVRSHPALYTAFRRFFLTAYGAAANVSTDPTIRTTRLLSRGAVQFLLSRRDAEMLMKSSKLGAGFASISIPVDSKEPAHAKPNFFAATRKAYRSLTNSFALPVRSIVWFSILVAIFNLLYTVYIFLSYLFNDNIAPGWTTQSLQISIGFFVFAIMFAFFGELLISIDRGINYRLRYFVQREVRSSKSNISQLRNIDFGSIDEVVRQKIQFERDATDADERR